MMTLEHKKHSAHKHVLIRELQHVLTQPLNHVYNMSINTQKYFENNLKMDKKKFQCNLIINFSFILILILILANK